LPSVDSDGHGFDIVIFPALSHRVSVVPTASADWDVSNWDQAQWSEGDLYSALKTELDRLNGAKRNNVQDALIAETSIKRGFVLVTDDEDLSEVTARFGGECLSVAELRAR
jgi:predicted nucleic acid-binding protein